jgi:hypothetical protein
MLDAIFPVVGVSSPDGQLSDEIQGANGNLVGGARYVVATDPRLASTPLNYYTFSEGKGGAAEDQGSIELSLLLLSQFTSLILMVVVSFQCERRNIWKHHGDHWVSELGLRCSSLGTELHVQHIGFLWTCPW